MTIRSEVTATIVPALLLVIGAALGPRGLVILTPSVLSFLDPAAPVSLAVIGIIAAMRIHSARGTSGVLALATLQASITGLAVAGAFLLLQPAEHTVNGFTIWSLTATALGVAAATSRDADDWILPVVAGGLVLAFVRETAPLAALGTALQFAVIAALVAGSGWLLLSRASTTDEQRISTFSSALLLGGAADYLSMSALLSGAVAGGCWRLSSVAVREHIRRDTTYAGHSLLALVLILAGARAEFSGATIALAVAYTMLRATGKLGGHWIARRVFPAVPRSPTQLLLAPGAFGVAFAFNMVRALGDAFVPLLTIVVAGTLASTFIAVLSPAEAEA